MSHVQRSQCNRSMYAILFTFIVARHSVWMFVHDYMQYHASGIVGLCWKNYTNQWTLLSTIENAAKRNQCNETFCASIFFPFGLFPFSSCTFIPFWEAFAHSVDGFMRSECFTNAFYGYAQSVSFLLTPHTRALQVSVVWSMVHRKSGNIVSIYRVFCLAFLVLTKQKLNESLYYAFQRQFRNYLF